MPDETTPQDSFKDCVQIGVVVKDLERCITTLTEVFGIGPFRVIDWPPADRADMQRSYHGQPGDFSARMAFTEIGAVELEIIQPVAGQNIWTDYLHEHGEGIHHIRFNTYDMQSIVDYLASQNISVAQSGSGIRPGTCWANFDTVNRVGFTIEVMQALRGTNGRTPQIVDGQVIG